MADFRKWILALSVLALVFTGVASAQVTGGTTTAIQCTASAAVPPQLRAEGYTELIGDITLTCTGGSAPGIGNFIPQANIVVNLPATITSRLIGSGSEALLLIDEPGASASEQGLGPTLPQNLCTTPLTGCQAWEGVATNPPAFQPPATIDVAAVSQADSIINPVPVADFAPNVYSGVVTTVGGNQGQVTFFGVPLLAPVTVGDQRVLRITNVRINAFELSQGGSGLETVQAYISVNNVQATVNNSNVTVGYVQPSLTGSFIDPYNSGKPLSVGNLYQCIGHTKYEVAQLQFTELFGTAFKTRVNGTNGTGTINLYPATVNGAAIQNIPGFVYNSESGFITNFGATTADVAMNAAGLADYGTRLKATFGNLPAGVSVYVSDTNENDGLATGAGTGTQEGWGVTSAIATSPELAFMVGSETGASYSGAAPAAGALTQLSPASNGSAEAIWEVVQTLPNTKENYDFGVYVTYPSGIQAESGVTASLSYAPTPGGVGVNFTTSNAGFASSSFTIPRFALEAIPSGVPFLNIVACNTALLFPYVTTAFLVAGQSGFDTGISIANTSSDPFNTPAQSGLCNLYWYGGTPGSTTATATNPQTSVLGAGGVGSAVPIISGTTALTLASQSVPANWSGYMIAVCNFQFAHGYASVTDVGVRNIMASYLALVIGVPTSTLRGASGWPIEALEN
jgi:hypothetical protein